MRKQIFILCLLCLFLVSSTSSFAARSVSITSDKASLFGDEELTLTASMSGFADGETIYLKGAFFKEGSTNYFGYTKSGDSWIKNSTTATSQRAIQIGNFDGLVVVKSDFEDTGYSEGGSYNLKFGFYYITSGGNVSSVNWSENFLTINLDQPTPTPTPSPTEEVQSQSAAITSSQTTTKTPTVAKTATKAPTPTKNLITLTSTQKNNNSAKISPDQKNASEYASIKSLTQPKPSEEVKVLGTKDQDLSFIPILLGGVLLLGVGGFLAFKNFDQIKTWIQK